MSRADQDDPVFRAIEFASRAHAGQFRKGTRVPYIVHPLRVAETLIQVRAASPVVVAGVLHDVLEDTPVSRDELADDFGADVARLVEAVSEPDRSAPWEERKRHTIARLREAAEEAALVACADKLDNIRSMRRGERRDGPDFWDRFHRPRDLQGWYYRGVASSLRARAPEDPLRSLVRRLCHEIDELFEDVTDDVAAGGSEES